MESGQLVGVHGLGVDQVLEMEMVIADGSVVVANTSGTLVTQAEGGLAEWSEDTELFWAWSLVTHVTVKMHRPRQECAESCYTQTTLIWENKWVEDSGLMAEQVTQAYLTWVGSR